MGKSKIDFGSNLALLFLIILFLFSYFEPELLLSQTTPAGGDTPSHFSAVDRFYDSLLEKGELTSWDYGNLAGYPLLQYYFPLPFILCVLLSVVLPLSVSFKIVTVAGVFLLPVSAFYFLRTLGLQYPIPILGSSFTLLFLFVESQSMWGGNIASTLAGEFAYSLGMALALFYLAIMYRGMESGKGAGRNSLLLALTGLTHGCALLVAGAVPIYCVVCGVNTLDRLKYYLKVNLLAFLFLAFWLVPWLMTEEYMTEFNTQWVIHSWSEIVPTILLPCYVLVVFSGLHTLLQWVRNRETFGKGEQNPHHYQWFGVLVGGILFQVAYRFNVIDIRFVPFIQLFLVLISAAFLGSMLRKLSVRWSFAVAMVLLAIVWSDYNSRTIQSWAKWNNEGFETKPQWSVLEEATRFLDGTYQDPRVVYEHSPQHNRFGSVRTFESLPYFSGRSTLEGVYMQSSVNSPFIFYLQSEVSEVTSCPLANYHCASLNLQRALPHLELFNVSQLILVSDAAKQEARSVPELTLEKSVPPLEIYRVTETGGDYVVPLSCPPVLYSGEEWKREAYWWFRNYRSSSVPVVVDANPAPEDRDRFAEETKVFPATDECLPQAHQCQIEEVIEHNRIRIKTSCIGHPLLVKMSYHPRWKVTGASKVYLAAPGFMIVFPQQMEVELQFGWVLGDYLGAGLTTLGVLWFFLGVIGAGHFQPWKTGRWNVLPGDRVRILEWGDWLASSAGSRLVKLSVGGAAILVVVASLILVKDIRPNTFFDEGLAHFQEDNQEVAVEYFQKAVAFNPESVAGLNGRFYWGISLFRLERYTEAAEVFLSFINRFPESDHAAEATYHIALCLQFSGASEYRRYFQETIEQYPESRWAEFARQRLGSSDLGEGTF